MGFLLSGALSESGSAEQAVEQLNAIAVQGDLPEIYRSIAAFKALLLQSETMPAADRAALDYFLALADDPRLRIELMLEPGDLSLINNYFILHSRTAFYDFDEAERRRLLFRLWLVAPDRRPVPPDFARAEGDGIAAQSGRETSYFDGDTAKRAHQKHPYQN